MTSGENTWVSLNFADVQQSTDNFIKAKNFPQLKELWIHWKTEFFSNSYYLYWRDGAIPWKFIASKAIESGRYLITKDLITNV